MAQFTKGKIAIPNVTGNIVINITAVQSAPPYTNLADPTSPDWLPDHRMTSSAIAEQSGKTVTNPVSVTIGDVIRVKGVDFVKSVDRVGLFGKNLDDVDTRYLTYVSTLPDQYINYSLENGIHIFTIESFTGGVQKDVTIRFSFDTPTDSNTVIITKNELIE